ncbi:MFS transporter [bacterium]|nr:MFS transporter [bacterium]
MILPLLPAFVTGTLGLGPHVLGIMEGFAETVASLLKYASGRWSDRVRRRKPLAVAGYLLSNIVRPAMGLAQAGWHVVALRSTDRAGKGVRSAPRDALLAASVDTRDRGRAFGFHRAMDHAGAVVGPALAFVLLSVFAFDVRTVFFLSAIPGAIAVLFIAFRVREKRAANAAPEADAKIAGDSNAHSNSATPDGSSDDFDRRRFGVFLAAMVLFTLGNSTDVFLLLHAQELGVPVAYAPVLWIVLHLSKTAFATPGGTLSDRIGRRKAILAGWGVYAIAYAGFAAANAAWQMWPLFIFYGLFYGLTEGPERAMAADLVPSRRHGLGFGLYHLSVGVAALPASVVAGYLWKAYGAPAALGLGATFAIIAALVLALGLKEARPAQAA